MRSGCKYVLWVSSLTKWLPKEKAGKFSIIIQWKFSFWIFFLSRMIFLQYLDNCWNIMTWFSFKKSLSIFSLGTSSQERKAALWCSSEGKWGQFKCSFQLLRNHSLSYFGAFQRKDSIFIVFAGLQQKKIKMSYLCHTNTVMKP